MADEADVSRLHSEYLYLEEPQAKVARTFVEYIYEEAPPTAKVSRVFVEYLYQGEDHKPVGPVNCRIFPNPPPGRVLQSQAGCRVFPVVH